TLLRSVNQYIVLREPWSLAKKPDQRPKLEATLYHSADALRVASALIDPVMPEAAGRIRRMLGVAPEPWTNLRSGTLAAGTRLGTTEALFPRIETPVEEPRSMPSDPPVPSPAPAPGGSGSPDTAPAIAGVPDTAPAAAAPAATAADSRISIDDF